MNNKKMRLESCPAMSIQSLQPTATNSPRAKKHQHGDARDLCQGSIKMESTKPVQKSNGGKL
jgi:hypothetical protein